MKRLLILAHRYLGIPLSAVFVVWFVSGIVMMYTGGMPSLERADRLARLDPIDLTRVGLSPDAAMDSAGIVASPLSIHLQTVLGRPAYRFGFGYAATATVFADDGAVLEGVSVDQAAAIAAGFLDVPNTSVTFAQTLFAPDQWTLTLQQSMPLYQFSVEDGRATRVYVVAETGDVALVTNAVSRFFAWAGVIPHWFYFTPLRLDQPLWYGTVVWLSALGCLLTVIGLVLAFTQFRRSRPLSLSKSVRYRGWMRWHYFSGALFGVFALTWVFSGLMSMEPFDWMNETGLEIPRSALSGGALDAAAFPALATAAASGRWRIDDQLAEVEFVRILGDPYLLLTRAAREGAADTRLSDVRVGERLHAPYPMTLERDARPVLVNATTLDVLHDTFSSERLVQALTTAAGGAEVVSVDLLNDYDSYYYSRSGDAPLPVLRIRFDDRLMTWYYVDPLEARVVSRVHRYSRIERWLFSGLHSLDFRFWYAKRPLWDIGMIVLSLGALLTSLIGLCLGVRRMFGRAGTGPTA